MDEIKTLRKIGLAKLFLWSEAERIQTYPEAFVNLAPDRKYTKRMLATEVFNLVYAQHDKSRPMRSDQIRNLIGLAQLSDEKVVIRGINLFSVDNGKYFEAKDEAIELGQAYRSDKNGEAWSIHLARQIAKYEVRTRLLLYLIGIGGWRMIFPDVEFFSLPSLKTTLEKDRDIIPLFDNNSFAFNQLLQEHRFVALGPWWKAEIENLGYAIDDGFVFEGVRDELPATNKLNSNIKPGLFLMKYLGVIIQQSGGWSLSEEKAHQILGSAIADDFVCKEYQAATDSPLQILNEITKELEDNEGYIVVSRLAKEWAIRLKIPAYNSAQALDEFIREQLYEENIRILARNQGQPRHGRGLFGDDKARKVKLAVRN
jgi:hypothetical protein